MKENTEIPKYSSPEYSNDENPVDRDFLWLSSGLVIAGLLGLYIVGLCELKRQQQALQEPISPGEPPASWTKYIKRLDSRLLPAFDIEIELRSDSRYIRKEKGKSSRSP